MKKLGVAGIIGIVIGVILLIVVYIGFVKVPGTYDGAVAAQEQVDKSWGDVEANYQRRADLIPNLVKVVKSYAAHEKEVLLGVTEARAKVGQIKLDASNLNASNIQQFQAAQSGLTQALSKLMVVMEKYPNLKADKNYANLQHELAGTENRITYSRTKFNESVRSYNTYIRGFWRKKWLGFAAEEDEFKKKVMFEADKGAEKAPVVDL